MYIANAILTTTTMISYYNKLAYNFVLAKLIFKVLILNNIIKILFRSSK